MAVGQPTNTHTYTKRKKAAILHKKMNPITAKITQIQKMPLVCGGFVPPPILQVTPRNILLDTLAQMQHLDIATAPKMYDK